jgi:hypothetical protein
MQAEVASLNGAFIQTVKPRVNLLYVLLIIVFLLFIQIVKKELN